MPKNHATKHQEDKFFRIGDVVKATSREQRFTFGEEVYPTAVVACLDPFVLGSADGKARWREGVNPRYLQPVGRASDSELHWAQRHLSLEERISEVSVLHYPIGG